MEDVMHREYRPLNEDEKHHMEAIKDTSLVLWKMLDQLAPSREISLAKTKIEEAVMWATKHITR